MIRVEEYMSSPVITCSPQDNVFDVCKLMDQHTIGSVVVEEGDKLFGIITERDVVVKVISKGKNPQDVMVEEVMTPKVYSVGLDATLMEVASMMKKHSMRRLLIVNQGKPLGIVTSRDIINLLV